MIDIDKPESMYELTKDQGPKAKDAARTPF